MSRPFKVWQTSHIRNVFVSRDNNTPDWDQTSLAAIGDVAGTKYELDMTSVVPVEAYAVLCELHWRDGAATGYWTFYKDTAQTSGVWVRNFVANALCAGQIVIPVESGKCAFRANPKASDWTDFDLTVIGWWA